MMVAADSASPVSAFDRPPLNHTTLAGEALVYGSVCSGIEAASVAWRPLGWRAAFFSEVDPFARAVLTERYPGMPLHGDFTTIQPGDYAPIELLVGGTPCQDFSVAGLRAGLAGKRGGLTIEFVRLAGRLRPRWLVWENVPGVLSIDRGRAFGAFLGGLGQCGYGFAYRVLDAQHFGVPQRRRRVFVVGYLGDWRPAAAVLFEPQSLHGNSPPCQGERQRASGTVTAGFDSLTGRDAELGNNLITGPVTACGGTERKHGHGWGQQEWESGFAVTHALRADGFDASEDGTGRGTPLVPVTFDWQQGGAKSNSMRLWDTAGTIEANRTQALAFSSKDHGADCGDLAPTLRVMAHDGSHVNAGGQVAVAFGGQMSTPHWQFDCSDTLQAKNPKAVATAMTVRRLTPRECERLQGFPDDYTAVTYRGKPAADGPRYRSLGNSMAVPCMAWLGRRIEMVAALQVELHRSAAA